MPKPALSPIVLIAFGRLSNLHVCAQANFCDEAVFHAARSLGALLFNSWSPRQKPLACRVLLA
jgi:hypothetical protein